MLKQRDVVYADYMASTPLYPEVSQAISDCLSNDMALGNATSVTHRFGQSSQALIDQAAASVAALLNANPSEIIWTSGATESINLAIKGSATFYQRQGKHIITMATEHKATLEVCAYLEKNGFEVTYLMPSADGLLDLSIFNQAIRPDTILLSIMHVNNETGVIQDLPAIINAAKSSGMLVHIDAAQSVGKLPIDVKSLGADMLSFSAHKMYGPQGIGGLWIKSRPQIHLLPQIHGGSQQRNIRSGTLPTHQIIGMGKACEITSERLSNNMNHVNDLHQRLLKGFLAMKDVHINGSVDSGIAGCLNVRFKNVDAEALMLSVRAVALSFGSACNSVTIEPSHVLLAMGLSRLAASQSLRISVGIFTTHEEIDFILLQFKTALKRLRAISTLPGCDAL